MAHAAAKEYLNSDTARLRLEASRQELAPWIDAQTRLVEAEALNYDELPAATWPDAGFRLRASACTTLTPAQAAAMPAESGMAWIRAAGFVPDGSFVYEASLLLAPDRRHEATIELIAPVKSCDDPAAVKAALATLRAHLKVTRAR